MKLRYILKALAVLTAVAGSTFHGFQAAAADFPSKTIKLVVPFNAGGGQDRWARMMASSAIDYLGQAIHVQNRAGAGGAVGWRYMLSQPADGHTIYFGSLSPMIAAVTEPSSPIKVTDVKVVGFVSDFNVHIMTKTGSENDSWDKIVKFAKANPGKLNLGGTLAQVMGAAHIFRQAGIEVTIVPYPGTSKAVADLLGGHISLAAVTPATVLSVGDKAKSILNVGARPDSKEFVKKAGGRTPWVGDLGFKGLSQPRWLGVHPDTSDEAVAKLAAGFKAILDDKAVAKLVKAVGEEIYFADTKEARETFAELIDNIKANQGLLK